MGLIGDPHEGKERVLLWLRCVVMERTAVGLRTHVGWSALIVLRAWEGGGKEILIGRWEEAAAAEDRRGERELRVEGGAAFVVSAGR